ncbi:cysteine desulfurase family protein [Demequina litorisediminis]|uniref:Cysteine desulfurase n=1 Tax=Demequina litorisediminis TaxID=1849022 RepID=A0ABQ6IJ39_9MICO|nr:cysteine desulfurase family protein [Demequina litorisediminis]GMA36738.1 cysteine desulfurase [Demequina litorisediminis]
MTYLDHAATTPMLPAAREAWLEASAQVGNASALHGAGRRARAIVEEARERLALALGAHPTEVIWTSGGTEADNLALKGLYWARRDHDAALTRVVTSAIEHHAGLDPVRWLAAHEGADAVEVGVDAAGVVDVAGVAAALADAPTALVSVMWANNEVGTVQPVAEVVAAAARHGVPVHSDAIQAVGHLPLHFADSGLATLALSAHKVGGPVGVGALLVRRDARLTPVVHGGGQERSVRSGTLDPAGAIAAAVAVEEAVAAMEGEAARLRALQADLEARIGSAVDRVTVSGPPPGPGRLPGIVHLVAPGAAGEAMLYVLDSHGVEVSNGSACVAGVVQASHVVAAMGRSDADAASTLRISMGATTTADDLDALMAVLPDAVARARRVANR